MRSTLAALVLLVLPLAAGAQNLAEELYESLLRTVDPDLIQRAEELGLYDRDALPVLRAMNPFFIRGDFNGDGALDVAFWVQNRGTGERGVAIVHSTLDRMYLFGAGQPHPNAPVGSSTEVSVDAWHLVPRGRTEAHPFGDVPEIGVSEGVPFTFERETLEFVHLGKSAFVFYWANGRYWEFWTAD